MPKIKLTLEDKAKLIEAIGNGMELSPEYFPKLFPRIADKFDVQALDRAKLPTLEYEGKRSKAKILAEAGAGIGAAPLQTVRCFGEARDDEWRNLIVQGDNLQFLKTCYNNIDPLIRDKVKGKIKLIYIDPPFATKSDFVGKAGERSYSDKIDSAEFIESLRERLMYMRELLADDGSIYVHLDWKMCHYIKVIMDEVFGKDRFCSDIKWKRVVSTGSSKAISKKYPVVDDSIFFYSKNENYTWNIQYSEFSEQYKKRYNQQDERGLFYWDNLSTYSEETLKRLIGEDRIKLPENKGKNPRYKNYLHERKGTVIDNLWIDIIPLNSQAIESINYPTQKPEVLLERIIKSSTNEGDLVVDLFCGSGTTAAVAEKLGRRWIACDFGKHAIYTMQKRLLHIGESKALIEETDDAGKVIGKKGAPYQKAPKPFCVVSSGAYDFSHIMELRKHKDTYIDFVLGLFQLSRDEAKAAKYRLANIYALKDNNPVEVYPVWDDQFLKEVKIDEEYLQGIIIQSGGKLKGDYYLITPESCANVGDTTLKNQDRQDVEFHILTFPYKVLEEVSRQLELQEQPSSQADVNNLITSTAFYFNEEVQFKAERTPEGFKITRFETRILDQAGNRFQGFSGLAMLLVDLDYEAGKPFDMDSTVFAKDIGEEGLVKVAGMTQGVGLIAIDKHGNESKPFALK